MKKYSKLEVYPPDYDLYMRCSNFFRDLLKECTNLVQRFSCDGCFLDLTEYIYVFEEPLDVAKEIEQRIFDELEFTVNIGISNNKLLSKVASSSFEKTNKIHNLYP